MGTEYNDLPSSGTELWVGLSGGGYSKVPGVSEITWDGFSRAVRKPTTLDSDHVIKRPALADYGQLKCKYYYDPNNDTHIALRNRLTETAATAYSDGDKFKIVYPDGNVSAAHAEVAGFVSEFTNGATDPETGTVEGNLTIEVMDIIGFTTGS